MSKHKTLKELESKIQEIKNHNMQMGVNVSPEIEIIDNYKGEPFDVAEIEFDQEADVSGFYYTGLKIILDNKPEEYNFASAAFLMFINNVGYSDHLENVEKEFTETIQKTFPNVLENVSYQDGINNYLKEVSETIHENYFLQDDDLDKVKKAIDDSIMKFSLYGISIEETLRTQLMDNED